MKRIICVGIAACFVAFGLSAVVRAHDNRPPEGNQRPSPGGTIIGLSQDVAGTATVSVVSLGGCPTQVCFSNTYPVVSCTNNYSWVYNCYTNNKPILSCVTNLAVDIDCYTRQRRIQDCSTNAAGAVVCTNIWVSTQVCITNLVPRLVCTTNGFTQIVNCESNRVRTAVCTTNTVTTLVCTNDLGSTPNLRVSETIVGPVVANAACDELGTLLPLLSNAVFQATWDGDLRQSDWRGFHDGDFTISNGSNTVMAGRLSGANGTAHGNACAVCNHFEGTLRGTVQAAGPLSGALVQATYAGDLPDVTCPSTNVPQGAVQLSIDGVVVGPCQQLPPTADAPSGN